MSSACCDLHFWSSCSCLLSARVTVCSTTPGFMQRWGSDQGLTHSLQAPYRPSSIPSLAVGFLCCLRRLSLALGYSYPFL